MSDRSEGTMVERVARALFGVCIEHQEWWRPWATDKAAADRIAGLSFDDLFLSSRDVFLALGCAAVVAMREPTEAMLQAGRAEALVARDQGYPAHLTAHHIFVEMIDAAMSE